MHFTPLINSDRPVIIEPLTHLALQDAQRLIILSSGNRIPMAKVADFDFFLSIVFIDQLHI